MTARAPSDARARRWASASARTAAARSRAATRDAARLPGLAGPLLDQRGELRADPREVGDVALVQRAAEQLGDRRVVRLDARREPAAVRGQLDVRFAPVELTAPAPDPAALGQHGQAARGRRRIERGRLCERALGHRCGTPQFAEQRELCAPQAQWCHQTRGDQGHDPLGLYERIEEPLANSGHVH